MFLQDAFKKGIAAVREVWGVLHAISSFLVCVVRISFLDPAVRKYILLYLGLVLQKTYDYRNFSSLPPGTTLTEIL